MLHDLSNAVHTLPTSGVVATTVGVVGYLYSSAVKLAAPVPTLAQAAVPASSMSWADLGQTVSGIAVIGGTLLTWYLGRRQQVHQARLRELKEEADFRREKRLLDAMVDIKIETARLSAKLPDAPADAAPAAPVKEPS